VVAEAIAAKADLVVAYHPPIFQPLKRLCADGGVQEALLRAAAAGLCVHSPHTALDAAPTASPTGWSNACSAATPKELRAVRRGRVRPHGHARGFAAVPHAAAALQAQVRRAHARGRAPGQGEGRGAYDRGRRGGRGRGVARRAPTSG
jgi:putative NIF3 family GTP cyclohydrolase 1 type 2